MKWWIGILIWVLGSLQLSFASGSSKIISNIEPLAINAEGDILCKALYSQNPSGARLPYDVNVDLSLCIVKEGKIHQLQILDQFKPNLKATDHERESQTYNMIFEQYKSLEFTKESSLLTRFYDDFIQQGFDTLILDEYRLSPRFSMHDFYEKWGKDYQSLKQVVLNGDGNLPELSEDFDRNEPLKTVQLQYQIGNQIWLAIDECPQEYAATECAEDLPLEEGIRVIYYISPLYELHKEGGLYGDNPSPFGYEYQKLNAIIFLPKN